jgi:hypothetical protein
MEEIDEWVSYGIVLKMPFNEIGKLKKFVEDSGWHYVYSKATTSQLQLSINDFSGSGESVTKR